MIKITPSFMLGYNVWSKQQSKGYIGVSAGINFTSYSKNNYTITNKSSNTTSVRDYELETMWPEGFVHVGFITGRNFEVKALYHIFGVFEGYTGLKSRTRTLGLAAAYRF